MVDGTSTDFPKTLGVVSVATTGYVSADNLCNDRNLTDGRAWQGDIAEILVYNRVLPDREREQVERALMRKYGIPETGVQQAPAFLDPTQPRAVRPDGRRLYVSSVAFSPDAKMLAAACFDKTIRLFDAADGRPLRTLTGSTDRVWHVTFAHDGQLVSCGGDRVVRTWEPATGRLVRSLPVERDLARHAWLPVFCVDASRDGKEMIGVSIDDDKNEVQRWDFAEGKLLGTLAGHEKGMGGRVWWVAFSPDGSKIASSAEDKTIRIWDRSTGKLLQTLNTRCVAWSFAFSPDGNRIAAAGTDAGLQLWDLRTGALARTIRGHSAALNAVAYDPAGKVLASASDDSTVRLWRPETGEAIQTFVGHGLGVWTVAFSPDGERLASGGEDGTVILWDRKSGKPQRVIPVSAGQAVTTTSALTVAPAAPAASSRPVNSDASPEARELLGYLYRISGSRVLSGQHNQPGIQPGVSAMSEKCASIVGKYPAVWGNDFGFRADGLDGINHRPAMIAEAIRQHRSGSIVTLTWHAVCPVHDEPNGWKESVWYKLSDAQWNELITPGSPLNRRWTAQVDVISGFLKQLADARVPVLWRPYHEMNGNWFWWGHREGDRGFRALWRLMYERMTRHHHLNNLLWVWSANSPGGIVGVTVNKSPALRPVVG